MRAAPDAGLKNECVGGGVLATTAPSLPSTMLMPAKLYARSYVHGEVKLTPCFTAGCAAGERAARERLKRRGTVDVDAAYAVDAFLRSYLSRHGQLDAAGAAALDSCSEFQDASTAYPGYGEVCRDSKFSAYSRIRVQEAGEIAKRKYGRQGRMVTLTCPGKGDDIARVFSSWSGYLVARFRQFLRDCLKCEHSVIGVWEWQRRGMLHVHLAVMCSDEAALLRLDERFKLAWARMLKCVMDKSGVDLCAASPVFSWLPEGEKSQQDCKPIRKDVSRYLAKYISKEKMLLAKTALYCPSRWVTVDRKTSLEARMNRTSLVLEGFSMASWQDVIDVFEDVSEGVLLSGRRFNHPIFTGVRGLLGWCEPLEVPRFWLTLESVVECFQSLGARITNGRSV